MTTGIQGVQGVAKPKIRYYEALRSWFTLEDGSVHAVEFANSLDFWIFVAVCTSRRKNGRINVASLVKLLNYEDSGLTRWHILDELLQAGCDVPLYPTREEALNQHARTCIDIMMYAILGETKGAKNSAKK